MTNIKIKTSGMHCKSCEFLIKDVLSDFAVEAKADLNKKEVLLNFDENKISLNKIKEILKKYKYEIVA